MKEIILIGIMVAIYCVAYQLWELTVVLDSISKMIK